MKKELKPEFKKIITENYRLRCLIANELMIHERTISRWCVSNSPKLTLPHFLQSLRKHGTIVSKPSEMIQDVVMEPVSHLYE